MNGWLWLIFGVSLWATLFAGRGADRNDGPRPSPPPRSMKFTPPPEGAP